MELHILDIFDASLWTVSGTLVFLALEIIAIFVCLERAPLSHKLTGFCITAPLGAVGSVIIFGDVGGSISALLPPLGVYPITGVLASVCLHIFCLSLAALIGGRWIFKRKGAVINAVSSLGSLVICSALTYSAWDFARYTYENNLFRYDGGRMDVKDALPGLNFLPSAILDSGIEIPVLIVFIIFITIYFLTFISKKTPEEIIRDDIKRRRASLSGNNYSEDDGEEYRCCACCEHAECIDSSPSKMLCKYKGTVSSSHVCRKYVYDPLKRKAYRPRISPLDGLDDLI